MIIGTTSSMFNHLKVFHPKAWKKCEKKRNKRKKETEEQGNVHKKRRCAISPEEKIELDELVTEMIAVDLRPYSCVKDRGLLKVFDRLAPGYELPHRTTISRTLMPRLYEKTKAKKSEELIGDFHDGVTCISFTTDCWTSRAGHSYMSLTGHYMTPDFILKNMTLGMGLLKGRHTGVALRGKLMEMVEEWPVLREAGTLPIYAVTDNARNITAAINAIGWTSVYCFAHTLNLALKDARQYTSGIDELLRKARRIVTHFHHSDPARRALQEAQKQNHGTSNLKLVQMVDTRWNSEFQMLRRLIKLKEPVAQSDS